jgi:hypothetical protein
MSSIETTRMSTRGVRSAADFNNLLEQLILIAIAQETRRAQQKQEAPLETAKR